MPMVDACASLSAWERHLVFLLCLQYFYLPDATEETHVPRRHKHHTRLIMLGNSLVLAPAPSAAALASMGNASL